MDYRTDGALEKEIIAILKDELSFYQSMFILIDKQKDCLRTGSGSELSRVFAEIGRFNRRIAESEKKLGDLMQKDGEAFLLAATNLEVRRLVDSVASILQKNLCLMKENEAFIADRQAAIREGLEELSKSRKMMETLSAFAPSKRLVDNKK
jgi:hypothetical protein